jgi:hypothetical protein
MLIRSNNPIKGSRNEETCTSKTQQSDSDPKEPCQIVIVLLARDPNVHAPEPGDDIHGEYNGAQNGELAEYISSLFLPFIHADVNLC